MVRHQGVMLSSAAAKRVADTVRTVENLGLTPDRFRRPRNTVFGPMAIPAIVTACYRAADGTVTVKCRQQIGLPHTPRPYDCPESDPNCTVDDHDFLAVAGNDSPTVLYSAVTLFRIHMQLNPEVRWKAIPDLPVDPRTLDEPPPELTTRWISEYQTDWPSDVCAENPLG